MEKKGIRTEKGEFNRWIKATNAVIRDIRKKIALLSDWIKEIKAELAKPQTPDLVFLLRAYYSKRSAGAYSQKGKISNLKEMNETFNYLRENGIYTLEDLESRVESHRTKTDNLKTTMDAENARMKAIRSLSDDSNTFQRLKPVYEGLRKIKFDKPRAAYKAEHEAELKQFYAARRRLTAEFPDGKVNMKKLSEEYDALVQTHTATYEQFKSVREDLQRLWKVKSCVDTAARFMVRTEEQMLQNQPQTRHKKGGYIFMKKYDWKKEYNPIRRTAKRILSGDPLKDGRPFSDLIELDEHSRKCLEFEATLTDQQIEMLQDLGYLPVTTRQYAEECEECPYTLDEREHGICRRCLIFKK